MKIRLLEASRAEMSTSKMMSNSHSNNTPTGLVGGLSGQRPWVKLDNLSSTLGNHVVKVETQLSLDDFRPSLASHGTQVLTPLTNR